ncbi:hypothetical protein RJ640_030145 [Escallonia rubra]|uniref:F-box/kelch-repeat protein n=1 Tax=Escallonia rubra TaxID=112253 RepID=A0AA88U9R1_9ASTE|nr:hypothetical protein RJ640_030145 [Escallonia rubra]
MKNLPPSLPQDWEKWGETSIFFTEEQGVIHVFALNLIDASAYHVVDYLFPDPQVEGRIGRVALGSRIYFFGGDLIETANGELTYPLKMRVYDLRSRTWRDGPDLLGPKPFPLVAVIEGKVYALPGESAHSYSLEHLTSLHGWAVFEEYDPARERWSRLEEEPPMHCYPYRPVHIYHPGAKTLFVKRQDHGLFAFNLSTKKWSVHPWWTDHPADDPVVDNLRPFCWDSRSLIVGNIFYITKRYHEYLRKSYVVVHKLDLRIEDPHQMKWGLEAIFLSFGRLYYPNVFLFQLHDHKLCVVVFRDASKVGFVPFSVYKLPPRDSSSSAKPGGGEAKLGRIFRRHGRFPGNLQPGSCMIMKNINRAGAGSFALIDPDFRLLPASWRSMGCRIEGVPHFPRYFAVSHDECEREDRRLFHFLIRGLLFLQWLFSVRTGTQVMEESSNSTLQLGFYLLARDVLLLAVAVTNVKLIEDGIEALVQYPLFLLWAREHHIR